MGRDLEKSSGLTPLEWHARYQQQAGWTAALRKHCYERASLEGARRILEVGCGSGVICKDLHTLTTAGVTGIDLDPAILGVACKSDPGSSYACADAMHLPFPSGTFDAVLCHFLLLWIETPPAILSEMKRVTHPGGTLMALAEPDYGGRIDHPETLVRFGRLQAESLARQGADPECGRKLPGWFQGIGLTDIEYGILGGQWYPNAPSASPDSEQSILQQDLANLASEQEWQDFLAREHEARKSGSRILYVPTFYAIGWVP